MSDRLKAGQSLKAGDRLTSKSSRFALIMQKDGNLVLVDDGGIPRGVPYWSSGSSSKAVSHLDLKDDGDLVIYDKKGLGIWSLRKHDLNASHLIVQDDGNIVIYRKDRGVIWSPNKVRGAIKLDPPVGTIVIDAQNATAQKGRQGNVVIVNDSRHESVVKGDQLAIPVDKDGACSLVPSDGAKDLTAQVYKVVEIVVPVPGPAGRGASGVVRRKVRQVTMKRTVLLARNDSTQQSKLRLDSKGKLS